jgi:DNA-binding CsgD family transcriptional regulator
VLTDSWFRLCRDAGSVKGLNGALLLRATVLMLSGKLAQGAELAAEQAAVGQMLGSVELRHARLLLAAWRGDERESSMLFQACVQDGPGRGDVTEVRLAHHAQAVLQNGLGNYSAALRATEGAGGADDLWYSIHALPEIVEAASRADRPERAAAALEQLSGRATASGTGWALGMAARSRALTSDSRAAEGHYREAVELLSTCRVVVDLARAHLLYGEWLRRGGRRQDARDQLRTAHRMLSDMGAEAFAARAARELRATGESPRGRTSQRTDELTLQEANIARLVAAGATSREVASQLFLSPRTIEAHLRSIFRKLGITSRRQLRELPLP